MKNSEKETSTRNNFLEALRQQMERAPEGVDVSELEKALAKMQKPADGEDPTKIWFLLDRSGSMQSVAADVLGGYNSFVAEQAKTSANATMTTIQFDSQNPFDVIGDGCEIGKVRDLTSETYTPRGATPLYDAIGKLIRRADVRVQKREDDGLPPEDQLILIFTDGLENASQEFTRRRIFNLIKDRSDRDWTFVFMGANQDSYIEGDKIGLIDGNVQNYAGTSDSVSMIFESASRATRDYVGKARSQKAADKERFFGDLKEAEEALRRARRQR